MAALKCPNPSCPFLFDPTQVPPGAVLTCPRCAMRFTLGASNPGLSKPPPPSPADAHDVTPLVNPIPANVLRAARAATPSAAPIPAPQIPQQPVIDPAFAFSDAPLDPSEATSQRVPRPKRSPRSLAIPLILGLVVTMIAIVVGVLIFSKVSGVNNGPSGAGGEIRVPNKNFSFRMPDAPWIQDQQTQNELGVTALGLRRTDPEAWAALSVLDYKDKTPVKEELRETMIDQLTRGFTQLPNDITYSPAKLAGQDAENCHLRLPNKRSGTVCEVEVWFMSHKGVGYWLYFWCSEKDWEAMKSDLQRVHEGLRMLDERPTWTEKQGREVVYKGSRNKYRLSNFEPIWTQNPKPTDGGDEAADLLMDGVYKMKRGVASPKAKLTVALLKNAGDPQTVAKSHVWKIFTPDPKEAGETQIVTVTEDPIGEAPIGIETGGTPTTRLRVIPGAEFDRSSEKLVVFAAIKVGDEIYVAYAECAWSERNIWERRLIQLVGSLRAG